MLSVFDSPAVNGGNKFVTADGGEKAEFSGEAGTPSDGQFYALYPYSESASYSDGTISAYLPQEQVAVAGNDTFFQSKRNSIYRMYFFSMPYGKMLCQISYL